MKRLINRIFNKEILCEHIWEVYGFSYVKCSKCGRIEINEELNSKLLNAEMQEMVDKGYYNKDDVNFRLGMKGKLLVK